MNVAFTFSKEVQFIEHYHNSSWLEHGGSPQKALQKAFLSQIDSYLKNGNKYNKGEKSIKWEDIEDCLVFISNNFSTQASYENQEGGHQRVHHRGDDRMAQTSARGVFPREP